MKNWEIIIGAGLLAILLSLDGCATTQVIQDTQAGMSLSDALHSVTLADLDAAMADAVSHNDVIAMSCYPVLRKYVETGLPNPSGIKGPISGAQAARDQVGQVQAGIPSDLKLGCAALVQDERNFILRLSAMIGSKGQFGGL